MKRLLSIILFLSVLFSSASISFAAAKIYLKEIKCAKNGSQDIASIYTTNYKGFKVYYMSAPNRIIVDLPNNLLSAKVPGNIKVNGTVVKSIRYSQFTKTMSRVVFDVTGKPKYTVEQKKGYLKIVFGEKSSNNSTPVKKPETDRGEVVRDAPLVNEQDQLILTLKDPAYKNISYINEGEKSRLTLKGAKLTEIVPSADSSGTADGTATEAGSTKPLYTESWDAVNKKYTLTYPMALADIGTGKIQINDSYLQSIEITNDPTTQTSSITFISKYDRKYEVITDPTTNETNISIMKLYTNKDKLVVIDAGHGGYDSGAAYAGLKEKDLNLKTALRVNDILKSRGINTYMTRSDDTFIPLYDRANIANDLNASLFLSIHHNAYNTSEKGVETLYYPSEKSKNFARVIQDSLANSIGMMDKGIIQRPNLVVLKATKMPSALAELGYITNSGDRQKIITDEFAESAALALSDAVVKALGGIDLE